MLNKRILVLMFLLLFLPLVGCFPPPTNQAPILTSDPITTATVGVEYTYDVNATDPDGDTLTYSLATPGGMTINSATGLIKWTPVAAQIGDNSVTVKVSDGSLSITQSFTIKVGTLPPVVNQAPVIYSTPTYTATIGVLYAYDVNATDPNDDALTYSLTTYQSGMTINSATGVISWIPTAAGFFGVTVKVADPDGLFDVQSFVITVTATTVAVTSVSLNKTTTSIVAGATETLVATVLPATATNKSVTWSSSAPAVATVANGVVIPLTVGKTVIIVTTVDGSKTATCVVTVNPAAVTPAEAVIAVRNAAIVLDLAVLVIAGDIVTFLEALADTNFIGYVTANDDAYVTAAVAGSFSTVTTVALVNAAIAVINTAEADIAAVAADKVSLAILCAAGETATTVKTNVFLLTLGANGSTITWNAIANTAVTNAGFVTRPIYSIDDITGNIVATITKGAAFDTKTFGVTVLKKNFYAAGEATPDETFTITVDGYLLTDFSTVVGSIEFDDGPVSPMIVVGDFNYTITYLSATGVATVTPTGGPAAAAAVATTETINVKKDGKTVELTLYIDAITMGDTFGDVIVTVE